MTVFVSQDDPEMVPINVAPSRGSVNFSKLNSEEFFSPKKPNRAVSNSVSLVSKLYDSKAS